MLYFCLGKFQMSARVELRPIRPAGVVAWARTFCVAGGIKLAAAAMCLVLAACCDLRLAIDDKYSSNAFQPSVVGNPTFVLEVYEYRDYDAAHNDLGQRFVSMRDGAVQSVGGNYSRSLKLKANPGTALKITTDNGHGALGVVGHNRELNIPDLCKDNVDGSYKTDGHMGCVVKSLQISAPGS